MESLESISFMAPTEPANGLHLVFDQNVTIAYLDGKSRDELIQEGNTSITDGTTEIAIGMFGIPWSGNQIVKLTVQKSTAQQAIIDTRKSYWKYQDTRLVFPVNPTYAGG